MGAIGRKMYLNMKRFERRAFLHCLDYGGDENSLQPGAECLVHAHDKTLHVINRHRRKKRSTNPTKPNALKTFIIRHNLHKTITSKRLRKLKKRETMNESSEEQHKRHKREESKERVAALTQIYKNYKKQKERFNLRMMTEEESKKHYESWLTDYIVKTVDKPPALISSKDEKTPVKRITNLISTVVEKRPYYRSVSDTLRTLNEMSSRSKNQSTYGANLKDIVTDYDPLLRKKIPFTKRFRNLMPTSDNMPKVLKGAFDLADTLEKHGDVLNTKILSPRFMPLINNHAKGNTAHLFSPNIMPFYKDDSENNILPLPDIIDSTGLKADDRESIIELIMEMSGAQTIVEDAFKIFKSNQSDSLLEDVDQVTQGMDELFDKFKGMLTHHQRRELAQQKYTFMNDRQLDFIYGHGGMLNSTLHRHGVNDYKRMSNREKEKLLINDLRRLADDVPKSKHTRKKRSLTVLAPFSFGPGIVSPSFLGPTVLSPNLFSPAIISPFMLSPPTLSPSIGSPLVLSPYFLSPNVISAAIFEVYLLSPYFIAPNVVNPYLMSPIILSPHMLCPDVVSPTLLSGAVLNPYFLSPSIFTESALAADIMSPSFLSKKKRKK